MSFFVSFSHISRVLTNWLNSSDGKSTAEEVGLIAGSNLDLKIVGASEGTRVPESKKEEKEKEKETEKEDEEEGEVCEIKVRVRGNFLEPLYFV